MPSCISGKTFTFASLSTFQLIGRRSENVEREMLISSCISDPVISFPPTVKDVRFGAMFCPFGSL